MLKRITRTLLELTLICAISITATAQNKKASPNNVDWQKLPSQVVTASWYSYPFQGRLMANGQRYERLAPTVASRTLPLGTQLLIINPLNRRYAFATVTDRGPYIKGRQLDVSEGLAIHLGFREAGITKLIVFIEQVTAPHTMPKHRTKLLHSEFGEAQ